MKQTSIEAYRQCKSEGLISKRQLEVIAILIDIGPSSANQIDRYFMNTYHTYYRGLAKRLSELERKGIVHTIGKRRDELSNKLNEVWDLTDRLPEKIDKRIPVKAAPKVDKKECNDFICSMKSFYDWADIYHKPHIRFLLEKALNLLRPGI